jgi:hypothetical protein
MSEDEPRIRVEIEQGNPLDQYLPPDAIVIKQDDGSIWIEAPGREGDTLFEDAQAGFVRQFGTPLPQPPDALNEKEQ